MQVAPAKGGTTGTRPAQFRRDRLALVSLAEGPVARRVRRRRDGHSAAAGRTATPVRSATTGPWTFSASGPQTDDNALLAQYAETSRHIVSAASPPVAIKPNNVLHQKAWRVASDGKPNQLDGTPAIAANQIISLNTNIRAQLSTAGAGDDPRFNYLLMGATWTFGGAQPTGPFPQGGNEIGTSMLANGTMETFAQGNDTTSGSGTNGFACHSSNPQEKQPQASTCVSPIFGTTNPLKTSSPSKEK